MSRPAKAIEPIPVASPIDFTGAIPLEACFLQSVCIIPGCAASDTTMNSQKIPGIKLWRLPNGDIFYDIKQKVIRRQGTISAANIKNTLFKSIIDLPESI